MGKLTAAKYYLIMLVAGQELLVEYVEMEEN